MPSLVRMIVREEAKVVGWMMTRLLMMVQDSGYFIMKLRTYLHKKFNVSKSKQQRVRGFRQRMRMLCENRSKEDFWYFLTVPMKGWKRDHFRLQISSSLCWGKSKMKLFHAQPRKKDMRWCRRQKLSFWCEKITFGTMILDVAILCAVESEGSSAAASNQAWLFVISDGQMTQCAQCRKVNPTTIVGDKISSPPLLSSEWHTIRISHQNDTFIDPEKNNTTQPPTQVESTKEHQKKEI